MPSHDHNIKPRLDFSMYWTQKTAAFTEALEGTVPLGEMNAAMRDSLPGWPVITAKFWMNHAVSSRMRPNSKPCPKKNGRKRSYVKGACKRPGRIVKGGRALIGTRRLIIPAKLVPDSIQWPESRCYTTTYRDVTDNT